MQFTKASLYVSLVALDEDCRIKQCYNCNEEQIRQAVEQCRKNKVV